MTTAENKNADPVPASTLPKEDLERQKLALEIRQLSRPWWKNTTYLAILLPTVIAVGTLIEGYASGYFSNQATLRDIKETEHKIETERLEEKREALEKAQQEVTQLTAKLGGEKTRLAAETRRVQESLAEATRKHDAEMVALKQQQGKEMAKTEEKFKKELAQLTQANQNEIATLEDATFQSRIDLLKQRQESLSYIEIPAEELIAILQRKDGRYLRAVNAIQGVIADGKTPANLKGAMLYVLFRGTGDPIYRSRLYDLAKVQVVALNIYGPGAGAAGYVFDILGHGEWSAVERLDLCILLADLLKNSHLNHEAQGRLLFAIWDLSAVGGNADPHFQEHEPDRYLDIVDIARDVLLDKNLFSFDRTLRGGTPLRALAPRAFLSAVATILANPAESDLKVRTQLLQDLQSTYTHGRRIDFICPTRDDPTMWGDWLRENADSVSYWMEPDLKRLHADHSLLEKLLREWVN
jgi:hypothetical protein